MKYFLFKILVLSLFSFHCYSTCDSNRPAIFKFLGPHLGSLGSRGSPSYLIASTLCFNSVKMTYMRHSHQSIDIIIESDKPKSWFCTDTYLIGSALNFQIHFVNFKGKMIVHFINLKDKELENIDYFGLHIFRICDSGVNLLIDIGLTAGTFLPITKGKPFFSTENLALKMVEDLAGYKWKKRVHNNIVNIDPKLIHSGDFLVITRMDGFDQLIQIGTGATNGHTAVAMWKGEELWVVESRNDFEYWPHGNIQKNKWNDWIKLADNAGYNVAILQMREEIRKRFDVEKAWKWYENGIEGLPYGIQVFIFSWIDTPEDNYPDALNANYVAVLFSMLEKVIPETVKSLLGEALNHRLGTKDLLLSEIITETYKRNMTFGELIAIPENDEWIYSTGKAMTCSNFIAALYKAGGIFKSFGISDNKINANEFHPRDLYMLDFWENDRNKLPNVCKEDDPDLPYCHLMGKYRFELPHGFNTVPVYEHMNEKCPSKNPMYLRPKGC